MEGPAVSVIIPALEEEATLQACLERLKPTGLEEAIVVDGGSGDSTVEVASRYGAEVLVAQGGRAVQCNAGAARARGRILCFLHADTTLPAEWREQILDVIDAQGCVAGAFRFGLEGSRLAWRLIEAGANWRSRFLRLPYGDQAIFVRRKVFAEMGGFRPMPFMEDVDFVLRLKRYGPVGLTIGRVTTSPRRWEQEGVVATTVRNNLVLLGYFLGINLSSLHRWYFRARPGSEMPPPKNVEVPSSEKASVD